MNTPLTIRQVALRTGLTAHTLRYYERAGLIAAVARAPSGQRRYTVSDMDWIGFVLRLKATGMPIGQIRLFAKLRSVGEATFPERRGILESHMAKVRASIDRMQQSAQVLQEKIEHYRVLERSSFRTTIIEGERFHAAKPL